MCIHFIHVLHLKKKKKRFFFMMQSIFKPGRFEVLATCSENKCKRVQTVTCLMYELNFTLKLRFFFTCFRALNSEISPCVAVRLQTCPLRVWHGKLLRDDGKFVHPFAVEFIRIQYINNREGNLMSGRRCHSTVPGLQHPSQRKTFKERKKKKKKEKKGAAVRNYACGEELLIVNFSSSSFIKPD